MPRRRRKSKEYILGIDESGTGAWAGPFTVAGIAVPTKHPGLARLFKKGLVDDSKKLTDESRRRVLNQLVDHVIIGKISILDVPTITKLGNRGAWRQGVGDVIEQIRVGLGLSAVGSRVEVILDGPVDKKLRTSYPWIRFIPKADSTVPAVAAASIFAKTVRNDLMIELGKRYPEFRFKQHSGYGTAMHKAELRKHGKTVDHRPIRTMEKHTSKIYGK